MTRPRHLNGEAEPTQPLPPSRGIDAMAPAFFDIGRDLRPRPQAAAGCRLLPTREQVPALPQRQQGLTAVLPLAVDQAVRTESVPALDHLGGPRR